MTEQRERLAAVQHGIWSHWMKWMFTQGTHMADGTWSMPVGLVNRWKRQMGTDYAALSEREKDSDREQADKIIAALAVDETESQRARAFAHTVEILAVTGAGHDQWGQRDDWIRVWVAARSFLMKPSGPDAWAQALRERPTPV